MREEDLDDPEDAHPARQYPRSSAAEKRASPRTPPQYTGAGGKALPGFDDL